MHVGDRVRDLGSRERFGHRDRRRGAHERVGVEQAGAEVVVLGARCERDRERAVVAAEQPELQVAEVAADGPGLWRLLGARPELEEARVVDDAGVLGLLVDRHAERGEQLGRRTATATGEHDEIGRELAAVVEHDARDGRGPVAGGRLARERAHGLAVAQLDVRLGVDAAVQHPLEGRSPTRQHHEVGVGDDIAAGHVGRQHRHQVELGRAGLQQGGEHVGVAVAHQVADAGEEGVGVAHLRRARAVPGERARRVGRERGGVALEDRDVVPGARERQGAAEPAHSGPHDDDPHGPAPFLDRSVKNKKIAQGCG